MLVDLKVFSCPPIKLTLNSGHKPQAVETYSLYPHGIEEDEANISDVKQRGSWAPSGEI